MTTKAMRPDVQAAPALPTCARLWTVQDVSAFLGVPVATLYAWRHKGEGPRGLRIGKHLRFVPDDVRAWVLAQAA